MNHKIGRETKRRRRERDIPPPHPTTNPLHTALLTPLISPLHHIPSIIYHYHAIGISMFVDQPSWEMVVVLSSLSLSFLLSPSLLRLGRRVPTPIPYPYPLRSSSSGDTSSGETPPPAPSDVCAGCGVKKSEMKAGCNGQGRIAGGVGAVIDWWPIKAYRPCPAFEASGGKYTRKGQITDEVLFGRNDGSQTKF